MPNNIVDASPAVMEGFEDPPNCRLEIMILHDGRLHDTQLAPCLCHLNRSDEFCVTFHRMTCNNVWKNLKLRGYNG